MYSHMREQLEKLDSKIEEKNKLINLEELEISNDPVKTKEAEMMYEESRREYLLKLNQHTKQEEELNLLRTQRLAKEKQLRDLKQAYEDNKLYEKSESELQKLLKTVTDEYNTLRSKIIEKENLIGVSVEQEFRDKYHKIFFKLLMDQAKLKLDSPEVKKLYEQLQPYFKAEGLD